MLAKDSNDYTVAKTQSLAQVRYFELVSPFACKQVGLASAQKCGFCSSSLSGGEGTLLEHKLVIERSVVDEITSGRFLRGVDRNGAPFCSGEQNDDVADGLCSAPSDVPKFSGGFTDVLIDAATGGSTSPAYVEAQAYHVRAKTVQFANSINTKMLVDGAFHPFNCAGLYVDSVVDRGDITLMFPPLAKGLAWTDECRFVFDWRRDNVSNCHSDGAVAA